MVGGTGTAQTSSPFMAYVGKEIVSEQLKGMVSGLNVCQVDISRFYRYFSKYNELVDKKILISF